ncbi:MAG TPA: DNA polymerase ligase N-terminal domain-containing protein [Gammaproteobacteria bacterium]|nr:DNA polymerase ligase N-terminal domain-containing protein [Gammaproteobacteria bacterium]
MKTEDASLERYRQKRDFARTPEPRGEARPRTAAGLQFVVQKHAARRLHYDFRLELDGVLKSWAIPKGPSLDPRERRLAVQTEDHPLEYAAFEGVIPKGEYGGGTVLVWDRGVWEPEGDPERDLVKGKLDFALHGDKLRGRWTLVRLAKRAGERGGKDNWLLIKRRDREAGAGESAEIVAVRPESVLTGRGIAAVASEADRVWHSDGGEERTGRSGEAAASERTAPGRPESVPGARRGALPRRPAPQLPVRSRRVPQGAGWLHEPELAGTRLFCRIDRGKAALQGTEVEDERVYAAILAAAADLPCRRALLDGVAAVFDARGVSVPIPRGEERGGRETRAPDDLVYVAFDLLHLDGWDLRESPLRARKELLRLVLAGAAGPIRYGDHVEGHGDDFHAEACRLGLKGVVSKAADAPYRPGVGSDWRATACRTNSPSRRTRAPSAASRTSRGRARSKASRRAP